jgi:hypothetical protein
MFLRQST